MSGSGANKGRPPELERLQQIRKNLGRRARILDGIRCFFRERGFLEVDTPLRVPQVAPEINISPFRSEDCFLSTSPELYMKRLVAAGYEKIFQLTRSFRKDERGERHQPEFTILEWYRTHAGCLDVIRDTEDLVVSLSRKLKHGTTIHYQGKEIDLTLPWIRLSVSAAFGASAGWDPVAVADTERFEDDLVNRVIPAFDRSRPTILTDYPAYCASLARLKPGNPLVAERAEVFIGGLEIANAFSELNDALLQEKRFLEEIERLRCEGKEGFTLPRRFLQALAYLPECGGIALGVDRLVMLMCDAASISDVIAFPWEEGCGLEA
ncbi:MAG: amino acid--tRNA ligase-related protein [Chloroflexota bacterium]